MACASCHDAELGFGDGRATSFGHGALPPPVDDGPLVLVETRKDLSQMKLPFEAARH